MITSRHCYWGKCRFCTHSVGYNKYVKYDNVDVINCLKKIIEDYNVKKFYFVDECMPPIIAHDISNWINNMGLDITWMTDMIFEKQLTDDEFLSFISKYNCSIAISIDGIQEKHDNNRVNPTNTSSYKQILHNLLVAIEKYDIQLEARTVVQENECDLLEIINNNLSLGFNRMHLMPVYGFESFKYSGNVDIWRKAIEVRILH